MRTLALALGALATGIFPGFGGANGATLESIMLEGLGGKLFSPGHMHEVRRGKVARIDAKPLDVRELAAAIACLVDKPTEQVLAPFVDVVGTLPGTTLEDYASIDPASPNPALERVTLGPRAKAELPRYKGFTEGIGINLSESELHAARALPGRQDALNAFVRSVAKKRYTAYAQSGLNGIPPYVRGPGWQISPAEEMLRDLAEIARLPELSPDLLNAWRDYPVNQPANSRDGHYWLRADLDGRPALILTHRLVLSEANMDLVAIRHYYFSHFFDSGQAMALVTEVPEGRLLVYAGRFWVDGWTGTPSLKQKIGAKMLRKKMSGLLDDQGVCARGT